MRFENSVKNSAFALIGQAINIILGFFLRIVFIKFLGKEYLGINGIMESMLTLISVTELGIGTSIAFALYKPIDENNEKQIGKLMAFYRKAYHLIGFMSLIIGICLIPFMDFFTKGAKEVSNILFIYLLFLANTVISYFFSYKRTLINGYQNYYITSSIVDGIAFVKYLFQIIILFVFKSYIGYILVSLVATILTNLLISYICDKKYSFIHDYENEKLEQADKIQLRKSVVSLLYQKAGATLVTGTDNLMISYVGIAVMGVYSNYTLITSIINRIIYNVQKAITGSLGNLMVQNDNVHKYNVYEEIVFVNFCIYFFMAAGLSGCLERVIEIMAGNDWILSSKVTFAVILNFFLMGMRQVNVMVIETTGLFNYLRPKAIIEVIVNLIISILFLIVFDMGIYGVLFGTTFSMVSVCIWWEAYAVHKYAFKKRLKNYYIKYIKYIIIMFFTGFINYFASTKIPYRGISGLLISGIISMVLSFAFIYIFFSRTREFKNIKNRVIKTEG